MYVNDAMSVTDSLQSTRRRDSKFRDTLTSIPLTDGFDAPTEAPTVWNTTGIEGVEGRDYEISITGYQNYVAEMERMLSDQENIAITPNQPVEPYYPEREPGVALSVRGFGMGGRNKGHNRSPRRDSNGSQEVSSQNARAELVEHRVVEDGPKRTISLWREQVAASTSKEDLPSTEQPVPRSEPLQESHTGRYVSNRNGGPSSGSGSAGPGNGASKRSGTDGYERTEYIISYQKPSRADASRRLYTPSAQHSGSPSGRRGSIASQQHSAQRSGSSGPISPTSRKGPVPPYEQRTEYMVSYLHTPPHSNDSRSSTKRNSHPPPNPSRSPIQTRKHIPIGSSTPSSSVKSALTSVELILASCEPSLLHIAPVIAELGIFKVEHLRAMARMDQETRDRELKGHALMRGVTVMEWAILIDKLQSL
ncbi:hypothetical protein BDY19DRAFT_319308 [Irpex rosettiformis]|uniref:Uncharacterized protein n=1 Tax=Irpex rosettiformis TaxID=378272 RepID=A0ACB8TY91_9APHY|nr:hypothetical protein BDY19DRAFT_319308 [Irpex rosettiformis]